MKDKNKIEQEEVPNSSEDSDQNDDRPRIIGSIDPIIPEKRPPNDKIKDHFITEEDKA
ncbi:MAG: hypothetical protein JW891_13135 [Candidatus Lokiarchaeota archaeon]|nr:hypothetical protein [Candidatus Lokiarchaeota archaeon]